MSNKLMRRFSAVLLTLFTTLLASCVPSELPPDTTSPASADTATWTEPTLAYNAATGTWSEAVFSVLSGEELLHEGVLYRVSDAGLVDRGAVALEELLLADLPYDAAWSNGGLPFDEEWVLVLGDGSEAGHQRFADVASGARFAFMGRVYATRLTADGAFQVRSTGEVVSEVAATFVRYAPRLLDLTLRLEDGSESTLSVTEGHPFYVPAEDTYRPVSELEIGTALRVAGGGEAVLSAVSVRDGDFEVFNFEVVGQHNYFAGESGVAVHNNKYGPKGGTPCTVGGVPGFNYATMRDAVQAASEFAGNLGSAPTVVRKRDFRVPKNQKDLLFGWENSSARIGVTSADGSSGWWKHPAHNPGKGPTSRHVNTWRNGGKGLHLYWGQPGC